MHPRLLCPSLSLRVCSNSCPLSWWCYLTISYSAASFSSCLQSFPASASFPMSQFFTSDGQSIRASASASVLPMNIQDWFPLRLTGLISLLSKPLSRVFSSIMIWKYQFFSNLRYGDDTTLMAKCKELKNLSIRVKEESEKGGLKLNIKKCKIMAFGSITWWHIEGVIGWRWLKSTNLQL